MVKHYLDIYDKSNLFESVKIEESDNIGMIIKKLSKYFFYHESEKKINFSVFCFSFVKKEIDPWILIDLLLKKLNELPRTKNGDYQVESFKEITLEEFYGEVPNMAVGWADEDSNDEIVSNLTHQLHALINTCRIYFKLLDNKRQFMILDYSKNYILFIKQK